jgi:hypothetical protein
MRGLLDSGSQPPSGQHLEHENIDPAWWGGKTSIPQSEETTTCKRHDDKIIAITVTKLYPTTGQ